MQLLAMPLLAELAAISAASPNAAATTGVAHSGADGHRGEAAPFGQLLAQLQGEGGKGLPPAELAAALGISVEQLQQALAQLRQALADYSRQQTGASGIMPALVDSASDGEATAVNEDGEAFLLWLADQQQGLAGEVDPALVDALQQWLSEQRAEPKGAGLAVGGEQPQVADGSETAALLEAGDAAQQAVAEVGQEVAAALAADQAERRTAASERQLAVDTAATTGGQLSPTIGGVTGDQPASAVTTSNDGGSAATVAAPLSVVHGGHTDGEVATDEATPVVNAGDKRQAPPAAAVTTTVASVASTTASAGAGDQPAAVAADQSDAEGGATDGGERRNATTPLTAALTAQQRQGDSGTDSGGQASGRDGQPNPQETAKLPEGEADQSQRPMGERLSQWHFQWERASNDAASGITSADSRSEVPDLRQLLNGTTSTLQPTRLTAATSLESSPLLRQFNADPAAALGPQVQVMVARSLDQMTVRLDPQELGSMSIKVQVGADQQVHVQFQVTNPATRDLVEQSLPRLRELLGDAGVQLGDAQVGQQQREAQARQMAGDSGGRSSDGRGGGAGQGTDSDTVLEQGTEQLQRHSGRLANGRLDFYV